MTAPDGWAAREGTGTVRPLARADIPEDTAAFARFLLGRLVVRDLPEGRIAGRIVETEAYLPDDPACHAYRRMTPRNRSLFLLRGHAYVYRAYGTCWMLNVSGGPDGSGEGVLIRALEPVAGAALMLANRGAAVSLRDAARGPGRLAAALRIDRSLDGADLCAADGAPPGPLWLGAEAADAGGTAPPTAIGISTRIGITRGADLPLRFFLRGSRYVSGPGRLNGTAPPAP